MQDIKSLLELAAEHLGRGDLPLALSLCDRILTADRDQWEALFLRGTVLLQLGRIDEAIAPLESAVAHRPDASDAANNLGVAYQVLGRADDAARSFQSAIRANPDDAQAHFNLGALNEARGFFDQAEASFRHVLLLNRSETRVRFRLGNVLKSQARYREAEDCYREVLRVNSSQADALVNLGAVLVEQERLDEAAAVFEELLRDRPDFAEIHANLSFVWERSGKIAEAVAAARRAVELRPAYAEGWNNLGIALRSAHRLDDARNAFRRALDITPNFPLAEFNLATTHLLAGEYREGWTGYARHAESLGAGTGQFSHPEWGGEPIPGRSLLVYADQGFGDTIQLVRFLRSTRERSQSRVMLVCQPALKPLLKTCPGADDVFAEGEPLPPCDAIVPLVRLPALLDVGAESLADNVPYLHAPQQLRGELNELLSRIVSHPLRVGLVWQGNPRQARDVVRSCPFASLKPLFGVTGISFVLLQAGQTGHRQIAELFPDELPANLYDAGPLLHDFADTAAMMDRLDLMLTVDTSTAHLAGVLGRPVWTLLCHTPDWRWHLDRSDSPWYPTMRLFRQPHWGDWESVVSDVTRELQALVSRRRTESLRGPHSQVARGVKGPPRP